MPQARPLGVWLGSGSESRFSVRPIRRLLHSLPCRVPRSDRFDCFPVCCLFGSLDYSRQVNDIICSICVYVK